MRHLVKSYLLVLGLVGIAACGGNVVIDKPGGNGGAGSSGGDDPASLCAELCEKYSGLCGTPQGGDCEPQCDAAFATLPAECKDEAAALYQCFLDQPVDPTCDFGNACQSEILAFGTCSGGTGGVGGGSSGCGSLVCDASSDGSCLCKDICEGEEIVAECTPQGDSLLCTCTKGVQQLGTCVDPIESQCSLSGCCSVYFGQGV